MKHRRGKKDRNVVRSQHNIAKRGAVNCALNSTFGSKINNFFYENCSKTKRRCEQMLATMQELIDISAYIPCWMCN